MHIGRNLVRTVYPVSTGMRPPSFRTMGGRGAGRDGDSCRIAEHDWRSAHMVRHPHQTVFATAVRVISLLEQVQQKQSPAHATPPPSSAVSCAPDHLSHTCHPSCPSPGILEVPHASVTGTAMLPKSCTNPSVFVDSWLKLKTRSRACTSLGG